MVSLVALIAVAMAGLTEATSDVLFKQGKVYHDVLFKPGKVYTYAYKTRSLVEGDHSNLNRDPVQKDNVAKQGTGRLTSLDGTLQPPSVALLIGICGYGTGVGAGTGACGSDSV